MVYARYQGAGEPVWGIVEGDKVLAVSGDPFGAWQKAAQSHALKDVKIELPLIPRTFYCVGLNYLKHLKEAADKAGIAMVATGMPSFSAAGHTQSSLPSCSAFCWSG